MSESDLKLATALFIEDSGPIHLHDPKSSGLREVAEAYHRNLNRMNSARALPKALVLNAILSQLVGDQASQDVFGRLRTSDDPPMSEDETDRFQTVARRHLEHYNAKYVDESKETKALILTNISRYTTNTFILEGFRAYLASLVLNSWVAYETLAADLWVAAVNLCPKKLGISFLGSLEIESEGNDTESATKKRRNPISFDVLQRYDFNLSNSLGLMLWNEEKVSFNSLEKIVHAYKNAFSVIQANGTKRGCPPKVEKWFKGEDFKILRVLEAARHALVHKAGRVDVRFIKKVKSIDHPFANLADKAEIPIDGEFVRNVILSSARCGSTLLEGVDKWLNEET